MVVRHTTTTATVLLWLALIWPARAEMPVQSWLDFYNGKSSTIPISVARVMASTYALGMADGLISAQIVSCPAGYAPEGDVIAKRAADTLKAPAPQPNAPVMAAVLDALTVDGCTKGPSAKDSVR
jgi:hypothetical protein